MLRLLAGAAAVALLAGCASATPRGTPGAASTAPSPVTVSAACPASITQSGRPAQPEGGRVPAAATIASVLRCRVEIQRVIGKGQWQVRLTEHAVGPAAELRAALNRPSEPPTSGPCPAIGMIVPYFVLIDTAGKAYLPSLPHTACGLPQGQVIQALNALPFTVISRMPIRQVESELAPQTGCSQSWKDVISIEASSTSSPSSSAGPARQWPSPSTMVRVCSYLTSPGDDSGQLAAGRLLNRTETGMLERVIPGLRPAVACSAKHTRFAVVNPVQATGEPWYVELDGCHRVLRADHTLVQATAEVLRLLGR
jgi:hypothetical protein